MADNIVYYLERDGNQVGNFRKTSSGISSHLSKQFLKSYNATYVQHFMELYEYQQEYKNFKVIKLDLKKKEFEDLGTPKFVNRRNMKYFIGSYKNIGTPYRVLGLHDGIPVVINITVPKIYNRLTRQYDNDTKLIYSVYKKGDIEDRIIVLDTKSYQ
jgi:hypothetical protein